MVARGHAAHVLVPPAPSPPPGQGTRTIISRTVFRSSAIPSKATCRNFTTTNDLRTDKVWTPSATWFLGAGVVFSGVSLMIRWPSLGIDNNVVQNDSPSTSNSGGSDRSKSLGARLAGYFKKTPPPVDQTDIVLDKDLTVTSWKQLEQTGLIKVPGIVLWGSNKNGLVDPSGRGPGIIMIPQRLNVFEGKVCRDLKLGDDVAAAVDEDGNVYQWGSGYNSDPHEPGLTLRNRDIVQVTLCDSKLYGLSRDGTRVYVMPKVRPTTGPSKVAINYEQPKSSAWRYVGLGGSPDSKPDPMTQLPVKDFLHKDETFTGIK
ncbi:hypothetical protein BGZ65_004476 [Modicella reniformis]|uniref:Uncharacterized protein n=1 Tax=Modicella reniformis TaxID=1440133 RepID=A0A9P6LTZ0_9FUNG|nr:hypothetical protein BGZ65_004476 [Modicella reniformis]